jgi:membrane-associated protease RseP (regulator of RpoE activity)
MFRSGIVSKCALLAILALAAPLAAQVQVAYEPHYLPNIQDAANQLQSLTPHLAPMADQGNTLSLTNDYSLARVEVNKRGVKLFFSKSPAQQIQFLWSWNGGNTAPPYAPYTGDIFTSIVFATVDQFPIVNFPQAGSNFPAPWCIMPDIQPPSNDNRFLCTDTQADAQALVEALATMVLASGGDLLPDDGFGAAVNPLDAKYLKKHPNETGGMIFSVPPDGAVARAGIQSGDILHAVNGQPYLVGQGMIHAAVREAAWHKPEGGVIHVEIFRNHTPMSFDVHYSKQQVNVEQLRRQDKELAQQNAAPPSGVHFGFQVRPVIQDDMAPLMLTKAEGLVVVSVENGSLADTMGLLAGDVILTANGAEVGDMQHFSQMIHAGAVTTFNVWRKGKTLVLTVPQSM